MTNVAGNKNNLASHSLLCFPPSGVTGKLSLAEPLRSPGRPVPTPPFFLPFCIFFLSSTKTAEVPVLRWEGRAGGDAGGLNVAVYFPSVCACESDYRSLSQCLASADGIIAVEFVYSGPHHNAAAGCS